MQSTRRGVATSDLSGSPAAHPVAPTTEFASPWRRLAAWVIDYFIVSIVAGILIQASANSDAFRSIGRSLALSTWPTYSIVLTHLRGQTLGRMALGIRIVNVADGRPPSWNRSTIRVLLLFGFVLVPILAVLNCVRVLWDPRKRGWHDRAVQTIVVRVGPTRGPEVLTDGAIEGETPSAAGWTPPMPAPLSRSRRVSVIAATVVTGVGLLGLLFMGINRYLEDDLVNVDFRIRSEPFEVGEDGSATYGLVDGTYRVTLKQQGSAFTLGELRRRAYALGIRADLVEMSQPEISVDLGCIDNAPEGDGVVGYLLSVAPGGEFALDRDGVTVRDGSDPRIRSLQRVSIMCVPGAGEDVLVLGFANGIEVVRFHDPFGHAEYTYVLLGVEGAPGAEVRFTRVWSRVPDEEWEAETPLDTSPVEVPSTPPAEPPTEENDAPRRGTFDDNGVIFRYPTDWRIREVRTPFGSRWDVEWSIAAGPPGSGYRHEDVRVLALAIGGAPAEDVARSRLDALAQSFGTVQGPTQRSVGGLPAFEGRILDYERYGRTFELRVVMIVDGAAGYEISCQYEPESARIIGGCQRIIESFRVGE